MCYFNEIWELWFLLTTYDLLLRSFFPLSIGRGEGDVIWKQHRMLQVNILYQNSTKYYTNNCIMYYLNKNIFTYILYFNCCVCFGKHTHLENMHINHIVSFSLHYLKIQSAKNAQNLYLNNYCWWKLSFHLPL